MSKKDLKFDDAVVQKSVFHKSKYPIHINEVDIKKYIHI